MFYKDYRDKEKIMITTVKTEILIENVGNVYCPIIRKEYNAFRVIEIEMSETTGARCVKDICEGSIDGLCGLFKNADGYHFFAECHDDVDFGRAKKFSSKMRKVMEQL